MAPPWACFELGVLAAGASLGVSQTQFGVLFVCLLSVSRLFSFGSSLRLVYNNYDYSSNQSESEEPVGLIKVRQNTGWTAKA